MYSVCALNCKHLAVYYFNYECENQWNWWKWSLRLEWSTCEPPAFRRDWMRTNRAGLFIREVYNAWQLVLTVGNDFRARLFVCLSVYLSLFLSFSLSASVSLSTPSVCLSLCLSECVFKSVCIFILYSKQIGYLHLIGFVSKLIIQQTKINDDKTHYIINIYLLP